MGTPVPEPFREAEYGFLGAVDIVLDTDQDFQRAIQIICTVAGNVRLKLADGTFTVIPVAVGLSVYPYAVKTVTTTGTTATATYANLK